MVDRPRIKFVRDIIKPRVNFLRDEFPEYEWKAELVGFGSYEYHGNCDGKHITIYARASIIDEYEGVSINWYVDDGNTIESWWTFWERYTC